MQGVVYDLNWSRISLGRTLIMHDNGIVWDKHVYGCNNAHVFMW